MLKRWTRLVKGLQIRRRLQAQYQRVDVGANRRGDTRDVDAHGKQHIIVEVSSADPEPGPTPRDSHDAATSEAGASDTEVRHPQGWLSSRVASNQLCFSQVHHDPDLFHAGGFIATADEIVQPFSLPRSQYTRLRDRAPSPPAGDDDVEMVPDSEELMDEEIPPANSRGPINAAGGGRGYEDDGDGVPSEMVNEPMKTMADLAAEHAERQRQAGLGSTRRSNPSGRGLGSSRVLRKAVDDERQGEPEVGEDGDLSEPSFSDHLPNPPALSKKHKVTSSAVPSRTNARSSKPTPKPRKKRARSPDVYEGSDMEHDRSSSSMPTSTRPRPKRKKATKLTPRASRTVAGPSTSSSAVPASDRILRSRKAIA